jgi:hypothetical protein
MNDSFAMFHCISFGLFDAFGSYFKLGYEIQSYENLNFVELFVLET